MQVSDVATTSFTLEHNGRSVRVDLSPATDEVIFTSLGETQEARFMSLLFHPNKVLGLILHHGFQPGCGVEDIDEDGYQVVEHG